MQRTIYVVDEVWDRIKKQAVDEGVKVSHLLLRPWLGEPSVGQLDRMESLLADILGFVKGGRSKVGPWNISPDGTQKIEIAPEKPKKSLGELVRKKDEVLSFKPGKPVDAPPEPEKVKGDRGAYGESVSGVARLKAKIAAEKPDAQMDAEGAEYFAPQPKGFRKVK